MSDLNKKRRRLQSANINVEARPIIAANNNNYLNYLHQPDLTRLEIPAPGKSAFLQ